MKSKYSERRICRAVRLSRSVMKYQCITRDDENEIETKIIELATEFGKYGYRMIADMMRNDGILINRKRVKVLVFGYVPNTRTMCGAMISLPINCLTERKSDG